MTVALGALYMCERDRCGTIALHRAAMAHERDTGHHTQRLTDNETVGLRRAWIAQNRCWMCGADDLDHEGCEA